MDVAKMNMFVFISGDKKRSIIFQGMYVIPVNELNGGAFQSLNSLQSNIIKRF